MSPMSNIVDMGNVQKSRHGVNSVLHLRTTGVRPGEGRILKCLQEHDRDLSAGCRDKFQSVLKRLEEAKQACAPDIARFCADVVPGGGRLLRCLEPHAEELTPACQEKAAPILKKVEKAKKPAS